MTASCAIKSQERNGNANAGHPNGHEEPRAELTGAVGSHTSSTRRVRHCWVAEIDLALELFGIIMLCLGLLATVPIGLSVPGLILAVMAVQLISGRPALHHL